MNIRKNETYTGFTLRLLRNDIVEKCATWLEEYGSSDPVVNARALRREFQDNDDEN